MSIKNQPNSYSVVCTVLHHRSRMHKNVAFSTARPRLDRSSQYFESIMSKVRQNLLWNAKFTNCLSEKALICKTNCLLCTFNARYVKKDTNVQSCGKRDTDQVFLYIIWRRPSVLFYALSRTARSTGIPHCGCGMNESTYPTQLFYLERMSLCTYSYVVCMYVVTMYLHIYFFEVLSM